MNSKKITESMQAYRDARDSVSIDRCSALYPENYYLGHFIEDLKNLSPELIVEVENGVFPVRLEMQYAEEEDLRGYEHDLEYGEEREQPDFDKTTKTVFDTWRGIYHYLSIEFGDKNENITVAEILEMAEFVNGKYLCSGNAELLITLDTPIFFFDNDGLGGVQLIGVQRDKDRAILKWDNSRKK